MATKQADTESWNNEKVNKFEWSTHKGVKTWGDKIIGTMTQGVKTKIRGF